jgi:hypothetical protein
MNVIVLLNAFGSIVAFLFIIIIIKLDILSYLAFVIFLLLVLLPQPYFFLFLQVMPPSPLVPTKRDCAGGGEARGGELIGGDWRKPKTSSVCPPLGHQRAQLLEQVTYIFFGHRV